MSGGGGGQGESGRGGEEARVSRAFGVVKAGGGGGSMGVHGHGGELLLALAALGGRNPGALDMGGALEPPRLTASPAPLVRAVLLRLIPTVLTAYSSAAAAAALAHHG